MNNNRVQLVVGCVDEATAALKRIEGEITGFGGQVALLATKFNMIQAAAQTAWSGISAAVKPAIAAVKEFEEGIVKTAAMITSFQGKGDMAGNYRQAKEYASALALAMEEVDAKTLASAGDLRIITEEMMKQRVVLDINNQKQLDAFANIANAAAVIAMGYPGKEIQLRQEIRSLMAGQLDQNSQLSQQLNAMVGGGLKEQVALHKKSGDLVEWLGGLLTGYAAASGDIQGLWTTITSTMETLVNQVLRGGFSPAFKEIVGHAQTILAWGKEHKDDISQLVNRGWLVMKGLVETVVNLFKPLLGSATLLRDLVDAMLRGLGYIAYAVLPPLADRVGEIAAGMYEWIKVAFNLGKLLWQAFSFDWDGVKATWADIQANIGKSGQHAGAAFREGFLKEIGDRAGDFDATFKSATGKAATPDLGAAPLTDEEKKAAAQLIQDQVKSTSAEFRDYLAMVNAEAPQHSRVYSNEGEENWQANWENRKKEIEFADQVAEAEARIVAEQWQKTQAEIEFQEEVQRTWMLYNGTFGQGMIQGLQEFADEARTVFQLGTDLAYDTARDMESAFSDGFFLVMEGKFNSLGKVFLNFLTAIQRSIANVLASLAAEKLVKSFLSLGLSFTGGGGPSSAGSAEIATKFNIGGGTGIPGGQYFHRGGYVVPRFHFGGLAADELPAILQTGEGVLSRKGMKALDQLNGGGGGGLNVSINLENKSGTDMKAATGTPRFDGKRYVIDVILENLAGYGELRHAISGVR